MMAFGTTKAPVDISFSEVEVGLDANTTFAKCVGTLVLGGEPMTSYVCTCEVSVPFVTARITYNAPSAIGFQSRKVQRDGEYIDIGKLVS